jgi:hypothetical protein
VADWARDKVREPEVPFAANDPRWSEAFARLDMSEVLAAAGYPGLADSVTTAPRRRGLLNWLRSG